jgi:ACS family tartrate transporter-like MFS transporter
MAAIFMTASGVAPIIGGPIASMVLRLDGALGIHGWRWLFLLEGVPPLVIAAAIIFLIPDGPAHAAWLSGSERRLIEQRIRQENAAKEQDLLRALRDPRVVLLGLGYACQLFAGYGLVFWVPLIVQQMGFSNTATGFVTALVFLMALPAMVLWAHHSDRSGDRIWHAALAALLMSTAFGLAAVAPTDSVVLLALAAGAIGSGSFLGPNYAIPAMFLSGPAMAGGIALVNGIGNLLGGFGGQYIVGLLREQTGQYSLGFAAFSAATLVTALVVLSVGRFVKRQVSPVTMPAE